MLSLFFWTKSQYLLSFNDFRVFVHFFVEAWQRNFVYFFELCQLTRGCQCSRIMHRDEGRQGFQKSFLIAFSEAFHLNTELVTSYRQDCLFSLVSLCPFLLCFFVSYTFTCMHRDHDVPFSRIIQSCSHFIDHPQQSSKPNSLVLMFTGESVDTTEAAQQMLVPVKETYLLGWRSSRS